MIRQAISCDICGAEKKQTNHWFVACEQAGDLRVSGWSSRNRQRPGTKHLCGQTCLHKLVDEFMARTIAGHPASPVSEVAPAAHQPNIDASLTSKSAHCDSSGARPMPLQAAHPTLAAAVVPMQSCVPAHDPRPLLPGPPVDESPSYSSRRWHAEAWERERERELHAVERRTDTAPRHRSAF